MTKNPSVDAFHRLFYDSPSTWRTLKWMGVVTWKNPLDLWIYQEILHELRPATVVECGTAFGGSALFMAHVLDAVGKGRIVTVDVEERPGRPAHPRIRYLKGSSVDPGVVENVRSLTDPDGPTMVVLDSDHGKGHVLAEMRAYAGLVDVGSYMIVEDGNLHGNPVCPNSVPGPAEAIEEFLSGRSDFRPDDSRERLLFTFNPSGYLRRVSAP